MQNEVGEHLKEDWDIVIKAINALPEKDPKITDEDVKLLNWFVETAVLDHYGPFFNEKFVSQRGRIFTVLMMAHLTRATIESRCEPCIQLLNV